ncbi:MAG TPA: hypothetical protein VFN70_10295, partial [Burkholderiales bacterium]|nr:hypothetical protein [Burkholderiales bacterium]
GFDVNEYLLSALHWLDEAKASLVVPGFDDAVNPHREKLVRPNESVGKPSSRDERSTAAVMAGGVGAGGVGPRSDVMSACRASGSPSSPVRPSLGSCFFEALQLADVVHHAVEQPLGVQLLLAAQAEAAQPVRAADVGEHRLHGSQPPAVLETAVLGVDLALHAAASRFVLDSTDE